MRVLWGGLLFIGILLLLTGCAPMGETQEEFGFFYGIWHGICLPFAIIGKIFGLDIGIYAVNNSGTWYWVGLFLGYLIISGSNRPVNHGYRRYVRRN